MAPDERAVGAKQEAGGRQADVAKGAGGLAVNVQRDGIGDIVLFGQRHDPAGRVIGHADGQHFKPGWTQFVVKLDQVRHFRKATLAACGPECDEQRRALE